MRNDFVGIDFALKNCSVVQVEILEGQISRCRVLHEWENGGVKGKAPPSKAARFFEDHIIKVIVDKVDNAMGLKVAMDFTTIEGHFGSRKETGALKAFCVGYCYRGLLGFGALPLVIPPAVVRKTFGLKRNAEKGDVHFAFRSEVDFSPRALGTWGRMSEHSRDATILAYTSYLLEKQLVQQGMAGDGGHNGSF